MSPDSAPLGGRLSVGRGPGGLWLPGASATEPRDKTSPESYESGLQFHLRTGFCV